MMLSQLWQYPDRARNSYYIVFPAKGIVSFRQIISSLFYVRFKGTWTLADQAFTPVNKLNNFLPDYMKITKTHCGPHKMPSRITCGPRVACLRSPALTKFGNLLSQVKYEQMKYTMSHAPWLGLPYQETPSITKLSRPSEGQTCFFKNGIKDLTHRFGFHTLGLRCHFGCNPNPPYWKNSEPMHTSIGLLDRALKNEMSESTYKFILGRFIIYLQTPLHLLSKGTRAGFVPRLKFIKLGRFAVTIDKFLKKCPGEQHAIRGNLIKGNINHF